MRAGDLADDQSDTRSSEDLTRSLATGSVPPSTRIHSEYVVYVDESGDHGLAHIDPHYPVFVLAFCIFEIRTYARQIVPAMLQFKFDHWGHDQVILHEHEIHKAKGPFRFLTDQIKRDRFMSDLGKILEDSPFTIVAVVIQRNQLRAQYTDPANPYVLAMQYGIERVCRFLVEHGQAGRLTYVVFEKRGEKEDRDLELEFRRVTGPTSAACPETPVEIILTDKKALSTGLQIADLVARPIGLSVLRPAQHNRSLTTIKAKYRRGPGGLSEGYGIKIFP